MGEEIQDIVAGLNLFCTRRESSDLVLLQMLSGLEVAFCAVRLVVRWCGRKVAVDFNLARREDKPTYPPPMSDNHWQ